ncbi:unnamed protein product [Rhodiola kirilowii]
MGSDVLIRIMKYVMISTRLCFTSVYHHPFLVGFLCWLYLFYRSFPMLFSLSVSASPVLITTALLLGTLLSYGETNLPQIEEKVSRRSDVPDEGLEAGVASEVDVVDRDSGFDVGKLRKVRDLEDEDSDDEKESERDEVKEGGESDDENKPLIKGKLRNGKVGKWVSEEVDDAKERSTVRREESGHVDDGTSHEKDDVRGLYARVPDAESERFQSEDNRLVGEASEGPYSLNAVYTSLSLASKEDEVDDNEGSDSENDSDHSSEIVSDEDDAEDEEDDNNDDEDSYESESDADESSSPDASMTDIMPMLDELHPLLDVDAPPPAHDDINSTAQRSVDGSSIESADDSENQEDDDGEDDNEEDAQSKKGEGDKPGITWTEDDQKNLMDMGTSELERNQRLENLIARRRARKMMRLADEKNLIDLESTDLPFNVPHISTLRRNPFDGPLDSYDMMGLPPIPGSAPSILQPRKNPFDLPYDQNEEKPVLTGDNFAQDFIPPQRDAFFRRHESFSVGPSTLGNSRPEMRWKPYFVPERTAAEEAYASIQRQLSEVSESKASSVPETESVSSATDHEDTKLTERDIMQEANIVSKDEHGSDHAEYESRSSGDEVWADVEHVNRDLNQNEFEIQLGDQGSLRETERNMGLIDESTSHVEFSPSEINISVNAVDEDSEGSSHSSPTVEMQVGHDEISMEMGHILDDFQEAGTSFSGSVEPIRSEMHLPTEQVEDGSDSSSVTSLSETNKEVSDPFGRTESVGETADLNEDSHSDIRSPIGTSSNLTVEIPDDHHITEPVYDSSPQPLVKHLWLSSESTDCQPESSVVRSLVVADESEIEHVHKEFEEHKERDVILIAVGSSEGINTDSGNLSIGNENQETHSASQKVGQDEIEPSYKEKKTQHELVQLHDMEVLTDVAETSISETPTTPHPLIMPADATLSIAGEDQFHLEADQVSEVDHGSSSDTDSPEDVGNEDIHEVDNESLVVQDVGPNASSDSESLEDSKDTISLQVDQDESSIPSSDDDAPRREQFAVEPVNKHAESEGESSLDMDQKLKAYETPTAESSSNNYQETTDSLTVEAESTAKTSSHDMAPRIVPEVSVAIPLKNRLIESIKGMSAGGLPSDELDEFQTPVSARYFDITSEEFHPSATVIEEVEYETEDFREMDEGLLAELDTVGDFSVPSSEQVILKSSVAANPEHSRAGSLTLNHVSETDTDIPVFEASSVDGIDMSFHQIDDGVSVEEVILPSLLFGGTAAVDSKDVLLSDSPVSETKEVSIQNEELVSPSFDALEKTEVEPTNSGSSVNTESQKEDTHGCIGSPKHSPEETPAKDLKKKEKSDESSSDSSSSDSD